MWQQKYSPSASDPYLYVTRDWGWYFLSRMNLQSRLTSVLKISGRTAGRRGPRWGCKWPAWTSPCQTTAPDRTASRCGPGAPSETHIWQWQGRKHSALMVNIPRTRTCFAQDQLAKSDVKTCVFVTEMQQARTTRFLGLGKNLTHKISLQKFVQLMLQITGENPGPLGNDTSPLRKSYLDIVLFSLTQMKQPAFRLVSITVVYVHSKKGRMPVVGAVESVKANRSHSLGSTDPNARSPKWTFSFYHPLSGQREQWTDDWRVVAQYHGFNWPHVQVQRMGLGCTVHGSFIAS